MLRNKRPQAIFVLSQRIYEVKARGLSSEGNLTSRINMQVVTFQLF